MRRATGAVIYEGPSLIDGAPIAVALTGLHGKTSRNVKTGAMAQTYIIRSDIDPSLAIRTGADSSVCGNCRHRSGTNIGRSCYVITWQGPQTVFRGLAKYPRGTPWQLRGALSKKFVRIGTYGDPSAVPAAIWFSITQLAKGWTGYTHHWRTCDPLLRTILMASVDTVAEKREAQRAGWRTFRVRRQGDTVAPTEIVCPASNEAGHVATCQECQLCQGLQKDAKSVAILPHGQRVKWLASTSPSSS